MLTLTRASFISSAAALLIVLDGYHMAYAGSLKPMAFNLDLEKQPKGYHYATIQEIMAYAQDMSDIAPVIDRYTTTEEMSEFLEGKGVELNPKFFAIRGSVVDDRDIHPHTRQDPVCKFTQNKFSGYTIFSIGGTLQAPLVGLDGEWRRVTLLNPTREVQGKGTLPRLGGKSLPYTSYRTVGDGILTNYISGAEIERSLKLEPALLRDAAPHFECEVAMTLSYPYRRAFVGGQDPTSSQPYEIVKMGQAAVATIVQLRIFDKRTGSMILEYPISKASAN